MNKEEMKQKIKDLAIDVANCPACGKRISCPCGVAFDEECYLKITDVFELLENTKTK